MMFGSIQEAIEHYREASALEGIFMVFEEFDWGWGEEWDGIERSCEAIEAEVSKLATELLDRGGGGIAKRGWLLVTRDECGWDIHFNVLRHLRLPAELGGVEE